MNLLKMIYKLLIWLKIPLTNPTKIQLNYLNHTPILQLIQYFPPFSLLPNNLWNMGNARWFAYATMYLTTPKDAIAAFSLTVVLYGGNEFGALLSKSQKITTLFLVIFGLKGKDGSQELKPGFDSKWQNLLNDVKGLRICNVLSWVVQKSSPNLSNTTIGRAFSSMQS